VTINNTLLDLSIHEVA